MPISMEMRWISISYNLTLLELKAIRSVSMIDSSSTQQTAIPWENSFRTPLSPLCSSRIRKNSLKKKNFKNSSMLQLGTCLRKTTTVLVVLIESSLCRLQFRSQRNYGQENNWLQMSSRLLFSKLRKKTTKRVFLWKWKRSCLQMNSQESTGMIHLLLWEITNFYKVLLIKINLVLEQHMVSCMRSMSCMDRIWQESSSLHSLSCWVHIFKCTDSLAVWMIFL